MDRSTLSKAVSGGHFSPKKAAALLAATLTVAVFCAADTIARSYPFGPRTRSVNDLGNQYVPFHAHLWDLLHGRADGGLFVNWQSGFGSSFLPDLGTYLSSPFALLVVVFPRDEIDLAVYVITVLKTASAGAAMAWLLLSLRPGRWWGPGCWERRTRCAAGASRSPRTTRCGSTAWSPCRCCAWSASGRCSAGARCSAC